MPSGDVSSTERLLVGVVIRWGAGAFGWIEARGRGDWHFAHRGDLIVDAPRLEVGTRVRFLPVTTPKGPRAVRIEVLPAAHDAAAVESERER